MHVALRCVCCVLCVSLRVYVTCVAMLVVFCLCSVFGVLCGVLRCGRRGLCVALCVALCALRIMCCAVDCVVLCCVGVVLCVVIHVL